MKRLLLTATALVVTSAKANGRWDSFGTVVNPLRNVQPEMENGPPLMATRSLDAERGRFELPLPLLVGRFSKPVHSTTLPPLRVEDAKR
jgi:hypothetical protein